MRGIVDGCRYPPIASRPRIFGRRDPHAAQGGLRRTLYLPGLIDVPGKVHDAPALPDAHNKTNDPMDRQQVLWHGASRRPAVLPTLTGARTMAG